MMLSIMFYHLAVTDHLSDNYWVLQAPVIGGPRCLPHIEAVSPCKLAILVLHQVDNLLFYGFFWSLSTWETVLPSEVFIPEMFIYQILTYWPTHVLNNRDQFLEAKNFTLFHQGSTQGNKWGEGAEVYSFCSSGTPWFPSFVSESWLLI